MDHKYDKKCIKKCVSQTIKRICHYFFKIFGCSKIHFSREFYCVCDLFVQILGSIIFMHVNLMRQILHIKYVKKIKIVSQI